MVSKREAIRLADDADLDLVYILPLIFFFFFLFVIYHLSFLFELDMMLL